MSKKILAAMLAVMVLLGLCACGDNEETKLSTEASVESTGAAPETTEATVSDGKVTYTIKVVDENGKGIASVMVQLCKDSCMPGFTNADGVAEFKVEAADGYHASVTDMPAGYDYATEQTEFDFASGVTEVTIVLKAA